MKFTKIAKVFAAAALLGSVAAQAATEIKVWCWDDAFNVPAARLAGERYSAQNPDVKVVVESIAQDNVIQKLNAALGAKNHRGLPDIVLIEDYRVKNFIVGYPDFLAPLNGKADVSNFVDYKIAASSDHEKNYGIPFDSGVSALFLRIDLFEKAGYTLKDLENLTWDKYIEMGKKIKEKTGVALMPYDPSDLMELRIMLQSAGSWYTDKEDINKVTLKGNAALKKGFEYYKQLNDAGILFPYSGWNQYLSAFQTGKVASLVSSCWLLPSIEAAKDQSGKWRLSEIPRMDLEGAVSYSNQGGSQWYVNNHSANKDAAIDFLSKTFGSDRDLINQLVPKIGLISTMKNVATLSNYQKPDPFFGNQLVAKRFVEWNAKIPPVNYGMHTKAVEAIVQEALQRYLAGEDYDTVINDAQEMAQLQVGI